MSGATAGRLERPHVDRDDGHARRAQSLGHERHLVPLGVHRGDGVNQLVHDDLQLIKRGCAETAPSVDDSHALEPAQALGDAHERLDSPGRGGPRRS